MCFTIMWLTVLAQAAPPPIWLTVLLPIAVALVTALLAGFINYRLQERRLSHALSIEERKLRIEEEKIRQAFEQQEKNFHHQFDQQEKNLRHEYDLQADRLRHEFNLQEERLKTELRTEFMAEEAMKQLLSHPTWKKRSFWAIHKVVGGFDDDELRKLLVRSGAVRIKGDGLGDKKEELWGLRERNKTQI